MIYFKLNKLKIKLCGLSNCISLEEANKQPEVGEFAKIFNKLVEMYNNLDELKNYVIVRQVEKGQQREDFNAQLRQLLDQHALQHRSTLQPIEQLQSQMHKLDAVLLNGDDGECPSHSENCNTCMPSKCVHRPPRGH